MSNTALTYSLYKHTFPNSKVYIGITCQDPEVRWRNGFGYRRNSLMWNAIQCYGWDNIEHEILYSNLTEAEANELEIALIKEYNATNVNFGYNIWPGGLVSSGWKHSEKSKQKMSNSQKGKHYVEEPWNKGLHYGKIVLFQYDLAGNFIAEYKGYWEASQAIGIPLCGISDCANNLCKTYYGYTFSKEKLTKEQVLQKIKSEQGTPKITIYQYNSSGELVNTFISYKAVMETFNICESNLSDCLNGRQKTTKGFVFSKIKLTKEQVLKRYKTKKRKAKYKFIKINKNTGIKTVYYNIKDLAVELNIKPNVLRNIFNGAYSKLTKDYLFIKEINDEN